MAFIETTLPSASDMNFAGSLHREEYPYVGSQTFTTNLNYSTIFSVEVTGVGALSESQYTLNPPKHITINDPLETGDFVVIIYGQASAGSTPYYTQAQTDDLLDDKEDKTNKGIVNGYASLDGTGKVPLSQLPPLVPTVPDATTTTKGIIKLAGDLSGTADLPTVPGLVSKENISNKTTTIIGNESDVTLYTNPKAVADYVTLKFPTNYSKIVYVNDVSPTTATIFDLNNPPVINDNTLKADVNNLYVSIDTSGWVYNSGTSTYVTKATPTSISNFYLAGTTIDAGNTKTAAIERSGAISVNGLKYTQAIAISGVDLNTVLDAGFYNGIAMSNAPSADWLWVTVERHGDPLFVHQTATSFGVTGGFSTANKVYTRTRWNGTWTTWVEILTTQSTLANNVQSGTTYTLVTSDNGKQIIFTNSAAITVTIPSGLQIGFTCEVLQQGTGQVSFATSATTLRYNTFEVPSIVEQWGIVAIDNIPNLTETYHLYGDLTSI